MAALTTAYETFERPGLVVSYQLSNVQVFKGSALGVNASGFVVPMAHGTADLVFVGFANESVDNSGGSAGDLSINVSKAGSFVVKAVSGYSPAQADVGQVVYANTDWEVQVSTSGLTNQYAIGTIVAIESTATGQSGVRIRIDRHSS